MAISRMQQPRQMYGLGSFVKKLTRKVTRPFTKVAKKIVPKEIAGIMRAAAPFLPPGYREAAYLLGTARQTGRISPVDLALTAAPTFFGKTNMGKGIAQRVGALDVPFTDKSLREVLIGRKEIDLIDPVATAEAGKNVPIVSETSGIFGKGGKMFQIGKDDVGIFDTKAGQTLFGKEKDDGTFGPSFSKLGSIGVSTLSLIQNSKTPDEAGTALAAATGNSEDYEAGKELFSILKPGTFDIKEQFRLQSENGRLM